MLRTPLKNSKSVSKPFKSPFESPAQRKEININTVVKHDCVTMSPLSTRNLEAKRVLLMDDNENNKKKLKEGPEKLDDIKIEIPENTTKNDLLSLKRSIFEMRQELDRLKSRERCTKKHNPQDLKVSINKWKTACQSALEIVCLELNKQNGQSSKISDVLNTLAIPHGIVCYSEKDDSFT